MQRSRLTADVTLPREPKQERSRRKQEALMRAAEDLFSSRGFENVTADDIAEHAGYGTGTFYNYFANKTQVFLMVAGRHETAVTPTLDPVQKALVNGASLREVARTIVATIVAERAEVPWLRRTWLRLALTDDEVEQVQQALDDDWDAALTKVVVALANAGRLPEPLEVAPAALATTIRVLVDALADEVVLRDSLSVDDAGDAAAALITGALKGG